MLNIENKSLLAVHKNKEDGASQQLDPIKAFSELKARQSNQPDVWLKMGEAEQRAAIEHGLIRGLSGWQWEDLTIDYFDEEKSFAMYSQETDPRGGNPNGGYCPRCLGTEISGGEVTIEGRSAFQDCYCQECEFEWTDVYGFHHAYTHNKVSFG